MITTQLTVDPDQPYIFLAGLPLRMSRIALIQSPDNRQMRSCGVIVLCTSDLGMNEHSAQTPTLCGVSDSDDRIVESS